MHIDFLDIFLWFIKRNKKKINWKIRDVHVSLFMEENLNNVSVMERYNASWDKVLILMFLYKTYKTLSKILLL